MQILAVFGLFKRRKKYEEDVYNSEGTLIYNKGDKIVKGKKVYRFTELTEEIQKKIKEKNLK